MHDFCAGSHFPPSPPCRTSSFESVASEHAPFYATDGSNVISVYGPYATRDEAHAAQNRLRDQDAAFIRTREQAASLPVHPSKFHVRLLQDEADRR